MMTPRCLVRGSLNNDEYLHVKNLVRAGQTIFSTKYERRAGGKGANQAVAIAKAGGHVDLLGAVGEDGIWLIQYLQAIGVNTDNVSVVETHTGRAMIQVADDGENSIILYPGANFYSLPLPRALDARYTHLLLQNEVLFSSTQTYLRLSKSSNPPIVSIFNPSPMPSKEQIAHIPWISLDWLIVNQGEATTLCEIFTEESILEDTPIPEIITKLCNSPGFYRSTNIICTLGAKGVFARTPHGTIALPAASLQGPVIDTTGAGDCFTGFFVAGLMEHSVSKASTTLSLPELEAILRTSVEASAICVQRRGTIESIPTRNELPQ
ncbi:Ribokinase [Pleurotus pulmonarius]|nr:hypothetical protein EYR38_006762 [Pleurotus pulmonarius]